MSESISTATSSRTVSRTGWLVAGLVTAAVMLMLFVFLKMFGKDVHAVPFMLKGQPAPAFTLRNLSTGEPVSLETMKGRPVVMNFWATWCGPCKSEHPVLEWGAREFGTQVQFVGVVFEDTDENAKSYLARHGTSFPQLSDPNSRTSVDFGVAGVPETYFIDSNGIILDKYVGPIPPESLAGNIRAMTAGQ